MWIVLGLAAAGTAGCRRGADGPHVVYRVQPADGAVASPDAVKQAISVVDKRLHAGGFETYAIEPGDGEYELVVTFATVDAPKLDAACRLIERTTSLEFRIEAPTVEQREWRELKDSADVKPPPELTWVPSKQGGPDLLVRTPERPLLAAVQKLKKHGAAEDSADYKTALSSYEQTVREQVFTGADIVRAEAEHMPAQHVVFFAFRDDRKPYFEEFTKRHVGEMIAIIIDGRVEAAPVIKSMLPGEGIIEGGGRSGFTQSEAQDLAAVLGSGSLPGRLVRVTSQEPK